jgi:hypothetical protein
VYNICKLSHASLLHTYTKKSHVVAEGVPDGDGVAEGLGVAEGVALGVPEGVALGV